MAEKTDLLNLSFTELNKLLTNIGCEEFRVKQVLNWLYKGIKDIDEMTNLPKETRNKLKRISFISKATLQNKYVSKDGTTKYLLRLFDDNLIESVLMKYNYGLTACISSQVGCKMGCRFCASQGLGFIRNLTTGEMINQVLYIKEDCGLHVGNIVLMGIGEPLDNYSNVVKFLKLLNMAEGLNISYRKITVSTCGLVPEILKLSEENLPINLSLSLHAPDDKRRAEIMPISKIYSIDKIVEVCKIYLEKTKRRITFEYAMIQGYNDSLKDASDLANRIRGMLCHVNLIPINVVKGLGFRPSDKKNIDEFKKVLEKNHISVTIRRELGEDINAACGQLRRQMLEGKGVSR
jgi:23S rRNA (adenine2503-C2)-methyltransferase